MKPKKTGMVLLFAKETGIYPRYTLRTHAILERETIVPVSKKRKKKLIPLAERSRTSDGVRRDIAKIVYDIELPCQPRGWGNTCLGRDLGDQALLEMLGAKTDFTAASPNKAIVFYHFTSLTSLGITHSGMFDLARCWPNGIEPRLATDDAGLWQCAKPVVWMTTDPEPDGIAGVCVRLAATIAATDRHLVAYCDWMRRKVGQASWDGWAERDRRSDHWWMYFQTIPIWAIVGAAICQRRPFWWDRSPPVAGSEPAR